MATKTAGAAMLLAVVVMVAIGSAGRNVVAQDQTVQPGTAAIWTDQSAYNVGDNVQVCYRIPIQGNITITNIPAGNEPIFYSGPSAGTQSCMPGTITPPPGNQCLRLSYPLFGGNGQTQTCFQVRGGGPGPAPLRIYTDRQYYTIGESIDVCYKVPSQARSGSSTRSRRTRRRPSSPAMTMARAAASPAQSRRPPAVSA